MDRRTLLAVTLCFLIFMGWQKFYIEPRMQTQQAPQAVSTATSNASQPVPGATPDAKISQGSSETSAAPMAPKSESVNVSTGTALVGNGPRFFTGWDLNSYRLELAPEAAKVDLNSVVHQDGAGELAFDHPDFAYVTRVQATRFEKTATGVIWVYEDDKLKITREIVASESQPFVDLKITTDFKGDKRAGYAFVSLSSQGIADDPEELDRQLVYWSNQSIERTGISDVEGLREVATPVKWIGATSRYFLMTLVANPTTISQGAVAEPRGLIQGMAPNHGRANLVYPIAGNSITIPLRAYFGPKEIDLLRSVEPTLDNTIDFGWFAIFAYPILQFMRKLYDWFHNYGVAIIVLTVIIKVLTFPLTYKSMKSMKKMAALQPQIQKLREKFKGDDQKEQLNREMMTLMRTGGYNPLAGCLPILVQMPVFFALYRVLYSSIELYQAPFIFWIRDLSAKDPYFVTPILLTLTMYFQQKLTPNTATDPMQAKMMQFMPVIFGAFMLTLPSGLTIYMLVNAIVSIIQQIFMNKKLGGPGVPAATAKA